MSASTSFAKGSNSWRAAPDEQCGGLTTVIVVEDEAEWAEFEITAAVFKDAWAGGVETTL